MDDTINSGQQNPGLRLPQETDTLSQAGTTKETEQTTRVQDTQGLLSGQSTIQKAEQTQKQQNVQGYSANSKAPVLKSPEQQPNEVVKQGLQKVFDPVAHITRAISGPIDNKTVANQKSVLGETPTSGSNASKQINDAQKAAEAAAKLAKDPGLQTFAKQAGVPPQTVVSQLQQAAQTIVTPAKAQQLQQAILNTPSGQTTPEFQQAATATITAGLNNLSFNPPLSPKDTANLPQYVSACVASQGGPLPSNVPAAIATQINNMLPAAATVINTQYQSSIAAAPAADISTTATASAAVAAATAPMRNAANNGMANIKEMIQIGQALINKMPPGPEQSVYKNYLKAIATAMANASQTLASVETNQSNTAKKLNDIKMNLQLNALTQQLDAEKAAEEANAQSGGKGGVLGFFSQVIDVCIKIAVTCCAFVAACVCTACGAGVVGAAVMGAAIAYDVKPSVFGPMNQACSQASMSMADACADAMHLSAKDKENLEKAFASTIGVMLSGLASAAVSLGNPALFFSLVMESDAGSDPSNPNDKSFGGGILSDALKDGCGCTQEQTQMGVAITNAAIQVIGAIVIAVCTFGSGSAAAAADITSIGAQVAAASEEATTASAAAVEASVSAATAAGEAGEDVGAALDTATQLLAKCAQAAEKAVALAGKLATMAAQVGTKAAMAAASTATELAETASSAAEAAGNALRTAMAAAEATGDIGAAGADVSATAAETVGATAETAGTTADAASQTTASATRAGKVADISAQITKTSEATEKIGMTAAQTTEKSETLAGLGSVLQKIKGLSAEGIMELTMGAFQVTADSCQMASQIQQMNTDFLIANLLQIKGKNQAQSEMLQGMIQMMDSLINQLMNCIGEAPEAINSVNSFIGNMYSGASQVTTDLTS